MPEVNIQVRIQKQQMFLSSEPAEASAVVMWDVGNDGDDEPVNVLLSTPGKKCLMHWTITQQHNTYYAYTASLYQHIQHRSTGNVLFVGGNSITEGPQTLVLAPHTTNTTSPSTMTGKAWYDGYMFTNFTNNELYCDVFLLSDHKPRMTRMSCEARTNVVCGPGKIIILKQCQNT